MTEKIQLLPEERALVLKHGYPFERLEYAKQTGDGDLDILMW